MGRTFTPRYAVRYVTNGTGTITPACWRGRATAKRLAAHVESLNASLRPGGVNEQAGRVTGGETMQVVRAELRENCLGGAVVATWAAPKFQVAASSRSPFDLHRVRIAHDTLRMNDTMARVMGGMTKAEAREVLRTVEV